jgi:hypothetical protein
MHAELSAANMEVELDAQPLAFAGVPLGRPRHVCAFFNSDEEEYRTLLPFIMDGFHQGQKAVHVVTPERYRTHLGRLASVGIDVTAAQRREQLELHFSTDVYLKDGSFDPERLLWSFEDMCLQSERGPFGLSRIVCQMDWATHHPNCAHDLIAFEARVNDIWCRHDDAVICVYDLAKFGGETIIDILRTHPLTIIGGILQHNPFFIPPEQFLPQLRERRTHRELPYKTAV